MSPIRSFYACTIAALGVIGLAGAFRAPLTPQALATPSPQASTAPPASPVPAVSGSPMPTPTPTYLYVVRPTQAASADPAQPQILEIDLSDQQLSSQGALAVRVLTSMNVNGVYAHGSGRTVGIPPIQPGDFESSGPLPRIPFFLRGKFYTVTFEAITRDGRRTTADVRIFLKR